MYYCVEKRGVPQKKKKEEAKVQRETEMQSEDSTLRGSVSQFSWTQGSDCTPALPGFAVCCSVHPWSLVDSYVAF